MLQAEIRINGALISVVTIVRRDGGSFVDNKEILYTYDWTSHVFGTDDDSENRSGTVIHNYTDGALCLLAKVMEDFNRS